MSNPNQILHDLLDNCPAETVIAEARKIGMDIYQDGKPPHFHFFPDGFPVSMDGKDGWNVTVYGTAEQWADLEQNIMEKPQ